MDTELYFRTKRRMTNSCNIECDRCPLCYEHNGFSLACGNFELLHPDFAVEILENWLKEHPEKTMMQDFFEKHPNAPKEEDGTPRFCPSDCGYIDEDYCGDLLGDCFKCWNRPMDESK